MVIKPGKNCDLDQVKFSEYRPEYERLKKAGQNSVVEERAKQLDRLKIDMAQSGSGINEMYTMHNAPEQCVRCN
ncbi:MAG: hypothetical protein AAFZ80_04700 [Cyanobacteria bacterium P01_A01_bin.105]